MVHQLYETFPGHNTCKHFEGPRAYGDVVIREAPEHYLPVVAHTARIALKERRVLLCGERKCDTMKLIVVQCGAVQRSAIQCSTLQRESVKKGLRWIAVEKCRAVQCNAMHCTLVW